MEFNKAYSRREFVRFLQNSFLPEDFVPSEEEVWFRTKMTYSTEAVKLGTCQSLDLVVYEVKHRSRHNARVSLSKEAFRMLADEMKDRALVIFVPEDSNENYRFSLIEITLDAADDSARITKRYSNPRRYSYLVGTSLQGKRTIDEYLLCKKSEDDEIKRVVDYKDLRNRFSVEKLTTDFYKELQNWFACALDVVSFPNDLDDPNDDDKYNAESTIRLITRLIFVWFLKQKGLIPNEFFDEKYIADNLLKDFSPNEQFGFFKEKSLESKYYKAILQNLFFAMLNSPITKEGKSELSERHFRRLTDKGTPSNSDFNDNKLMRYESMFKNPQLFIDLANQTVPFLNGGLFDCLDNKKKKFYLDGFSDKAEVKKALIVPDYLFFSDDIVADLSTFFNDKKKYNEHVTGIIKIFGRYNFTIEENTPFDQEVSLDPELLGKVFENLLASYNPETHTTARKQTGSFYTPREIVQYMVDESLVAHLKQVVGNELEEEYRKLLRYTDEELTLTDEQKYSIMNAIYNCKVLDPACGSGAFPVGMLQQMVHILSQLDPSNDVWQQMVLNEAVKESHNAFLAETLEEREQRLNEINETFDDQLKNPDYKRKLYLIENCLYGVDIQSIAIQICKLRFFISLVVDQKTNNKPEDNFGIRPLPNLEAKFVAADTLIGLNKKNDFSLFDNEQVKDKMRQMKEINHKIFYVKHKAKEKYKAKIQEIQCEIADLLIKNGAIGNGEAQQIQTWDRFNQNSSAPFFNPEWMFGVKDGFDIVIGNPPYIQLQVNNGELAELYAPCGYKTFVRTGDIYSLFYERGWQLLKSGGCLCYITSNKWMRAGYGENTRAFFTKYTNPEILIDFSGIDIFESATVVTNILLFTRRENTGITFCVATSNKNKDCLNNLPDYVEKNKYIQELKTSDGWTILTPIELSIKNKIIEVGIPLNKWNIKINRGILTGYNDAFIIDSAKRNEILDNCKTEEERMKTDVLIRPILRGRDIKRYGYDWAGLWIINTHNGINGELEKVVIDEFPAIKKHLDTYWKEISKRSDKGSTPYNLRNCAYLFDFDKPKIIYPETTKAARFAYDESGIFIDKTCFMLISDDALYLQKTLSSKLFEVAYNKMFSSVELVNHTYQYNKHALVKLPIINDRDAIIQLSSIEDEESIDLFVYKLYGLTYDEILIVDPQTPITREEYERTKLE